MSLSPEKKNTHLHIHIHIFIVRDNKSLNRNQTKEWRKEHARTREDNCRQEEEEQQLKILKLILMFIDYRLDHKWLQLIDWVEVRQRLTTYVPICLVVEACNVIYLIV